MTYLENYKNGFTFNEIKQDKEENTDMIANKIVSGMSEDIVKTHQDNLRKRIFEKINNGKDIQEIAFELKIPLKVVKRIVN